MDAAFSQDLARWIEVQRAAGLDFVSDGLLRWQDIFRPLVEGLGIRPHTLVRWFDTNTFFREPAFSGKVARLAKLDGAMPDDSVPRPRVTTLPSPYLFSREAATDQNRNRLMVGLAEQVLRPAIDEAVIRGSELIHLQEPWLAYHGIEASDWAPLAEALDVLHRNLRAGLVLHVYFGDAAPHLSQLRKLPIDAIGIDFLESDTAALGGDWNLDLVAGLINGRDSNVEPVDGLVEAARHLADTVHPRNLYLTSNCELSYLPTTVAERKVQRLGEAGRKLKELVSV